MSNFYPMLVDLDQTNIILRWFNIAENAKLHNQNDIYEAALQKIRECIEKDLGKVLIQDLRAIPVPKNSNVEFTIENWVSCAKEDGIFYIDTSIENVKS